MDGYDETTNVFSNWLKDVAHVRMSPKITIADLRHVNQGRCVLATQEIDLQEILFEIPRATILNVSTSQLAHRYPELKPRLLGEIGHWEGLILCMLYEMKILREHSHWWAYFQVLPRPDEINSLMYWTDEQLEGLKPSLIVNRVGVAEAKDMYHRVLTHINEFGPSFSVELGNIEWSDFVYVASIIMSYSFDVEIAGVDNNEIDEEGSSNIKSDGYMKSMIPLADTLNADTRKCNANLVYDTQSLKMCAIKPIKMGEQVYNIYGDHPNSELLRRYGYVEWGGSKHDFGELPMTTLLNVIQEKFHIEHAFISQIVEIIRSDSVIFDTLEGENIALDAYDCYSDGQVIPECVVFLQVMTTILQTPNLKSLDRSSVQKILQRVVKKCIQLVQGGRVSKNCAKLWSCAVEARLKEYPSHAFREITPDHYAIPDVDCLRRRMTEKVLQSEVESLQNCYKSMELNFKLIPDAKLMENVSKRKLPAKKFRNVKRVKR